MVRPDGTNYEEADRVPEIRRPQLDELLEKRFRAHHVRNPDLYDKERDRDGEHPIGKGLYSSCIAIRPAARGNRESPFFLMPAPQCAPPMSPGAMSRSPIREAASNVESAPRSGTRP